MAYNSYCRIWAVCTRYLLRAPYLVQRMTDPLFVVDIHQHTSTVFGHTDAGKGLTPIIETLAGWTENYINEIKIHKIKV